MDISFNAEECVMPLEELQKERVVSWVAETIANEDALEGDLTIVFCSDDYLLNINKEYLQHDYYTDVITFDYGFDEENQLVTSGDLFISVDTVRNNAEIFGVDFNTELHRVIIHGVLHLLGYKDKQDSEQEEMTSKENYYLERLILS